MYTEVKIIQTEQNIYQGISSTTSISFWFIHIAIGRPGWDQITSYTPQPSMGTTRGARKCWVISSIWASARCMATSTAVNQPIRIHCDIHS